MVSRASLSPARSFLPAGWLFGLLLLGLCQVMPALAARIEVSLDRNPVPLNESFTLTFSADDTPDDDPDFAPLRQDFEILTQSRSSQFSLNNGHASRSIQWQLGLLAKRSGTLAIPAIAFGQDHSDPFTVTILPAAANRSTEAGADLFLEVDAEPKNPYVQAQVIYTIRVLSRIVFSGDLGKPELDDTPIEKLDDDHSYTTTRGGLQYKVDERRYVIFPQKSGPLRIGPVTLEARIPSGGRARLGPFFNQSTRIQRFHSEPVDLEVRPVPPAFKGGHWLPAASLELSDQFDRDPPEASSGEPITRTLTIRAAGATAGILPELAALAPTPPELKRYPDQPVVREEKGRDSYLGVRQEKMALIGTRPGIYQLPAVEIPWWDTRADRLQIARIPERSLTILPAADSAQPTPTAPPPVEAPVAPAHAPAVAPALASADPWFWLALAAMLGWLLSALVWWRSTRAGPAAEPKVAAAPRAPAMDGPQRALERACRANDAAAARRALTLWASQHWPRGGSQDLAQRVGGALAEEIGRLDRALYSPGGGDWSGTGLWVAFREFLDRADTVPAAPVSPGLEPLHKL